MFLRYFGTKLILLLLLLFLNECYRDYDDLTSSLRKNILSLITTDLISLV